MKFLGFTLNLKREPRYIPYEELKPIYEQLQALNEVDEKLFKMVEAVRVRVYQKAKDNEDQGPPVDQPKGPDQPDISKLVVPGADPSIIFGR